MQFLIGSFIEEIFIILLIRIQYKTIEAIKTINYKINFSIKYILIDPVAFR